MMLLTCSDIVLRLFRHPILGTWEIVGFLGAIVAGFAMARTTIERGHVAVEIVVVRFSLSIQKTIYLVIHVLSLLLFGLLTLECIRYGNDLRIAGEVSPTIQIPFFPVLYGVGFSSLVVFLILFIDFLLVMVGKEKAWYEWK